MFVILNKEKQDKYKTRKVVIMEKNIIEIHNLSFQYDTMRDKKTLDTISLSIKEGDWVTIIGPNGSGKSTLIKMINAILEADEGEIFVSDMPLNEENLWAIREKVGMVFQNPENQFVGSSVEDDVAFGLENSGIPREDMLVRVKESLERVGMWDMRNKAPSNLSGGQMQRVAIAGIIALRPDIIIMDESTSMLDPKGREEVLNTVKQIKEQDNLTVISITHDLNEAVESDEIIVMEAGQIVETGTPEEIFSYGEELIKMGLDVPFSEQLKKSLKKQGLHLPDYYLNEEALLEWLETYNSKM